MNGVAAFAGANSATQTQRFPAGREKFADVNRGPRGDSVIDSNGKLSRACS